MEKSIPYGNMNITSMYSSIFKFQNCFNDDTMAIIKYQEPNNNPR